MIQDLWVINEGGITIFQKIHNISIGDQLFGMLMNALDTIAHEMSDEGISGFSMNKLQFHFLRKNDLTFVASSLTKTNEKKVLRELQYVMNIFFEKYPRDDLSNWDGDLTVFSEFEQIINKPKQEIIGDCIEKLWGK